MHIDAISGCDTVSALFKVGKKKSLKVLQQGDWQVITVFKKVDATHGKITRAGEMFVMKLCSANQLPVTLDGFRFVLYMQKMKTSSSSFQLESLPPT